MQDDRLDVKTEKETLAEADYPKIGAELLAVVPMAEVERRSLSGWALVETLHSDHVVLVATDVPDPHYKRPEGYSSAPKYITLDYGPATREDPLLHRDPLPTMVPEGLQRVFRQEVVRVSVALMTMNAASLEASLASRLESVAEREAALHRGESASQARINALEEELREVRAASARELEAMKKESASLKSDVAWLNERFSASSRAKQKLETDLAKVKRFIGEKAFNDALVS